MKKIELTKEHESRLLEMCKKLFPEYQWDFSFMKREGNIKYWNNKMKHSKFIHWFEFCSFYLADKIYNDEMEESYMSNKDFYMGGLVYKDKSQNPIDILYEEFKELKL